MSLFDVGTMTELLNRSLTGAAVILLSWCFAWG